MLSKMAFNQSYFEMAGRQLPIAFGDGAVINIAAGRFG
jgi:hypothetical protein